jgi:uncharacterized protein
MLTERLEFGRLLELAGRNALGEFRVSADSFPRLQKILVDDQPGELELRVAFALAGDGLPRMRLRVEGSLGLICQRCLERLDWPLGLDVQLALLADEKDAEQLADPFDSIAVPADGLWLAEVIEDELLAAMPIATVHTEQKRCRATAAPDETDDRTARPFASLRERMQQQGGSGKPN